MASKTSKKTTVTSSSSSTTTQSQMPSTSTPISGRRPESPISPTRCSFLQEKHDLQDLNNRLACYIERVRQLESENYRLTREKQTSEETITREVSNIKSMYEHELSDTRKLLDDTAKERAKLEIDTKRLWDDNEELRTKLEKKSKELSTAERSLILCESRCNDLQVQCNQLQAEGAKLSERERELKKEVERLRVLLEDARKHLEEETLQRIDLENNIQTLKEDISFKDQVYQQELTESRTRRQVEISEIDGRLTEQYEAKLQQSLQELRDQYEAQIRAHREDLELLYENKLSNLSSHARRNSGATSMAVEELRQARSRIDALNQTIADLESTVNTLTTQKRDLENLRENDRTRNAEAIANLEAELAHMRDQMAQQYQEYQDLMDVKVSLDLEIAAYRKLLESEESRLNITPAEYQSPTGGRSTPSRHTPVRGSKRKRTMMEESEERSATDYSVSSTARGDIEITEADPQGRFVKLTNKGTKEIALSGWQIIRKAGTHETTFKFHRTAKIDAGASVMVWSADIGATHEPPSNIVMKGQKWFVAEQMKTVLRNNEGEEMATSDRKRQQLSTSVTRHRENIGFRTQEDLHHQQTRYLYPY